MPMSPMLRAHQQRCSLLLCVPHFGLWVRASLLCQSTFRFGQPYSWLAFLSDWLLFPESAQSENYSNNSSKAPFWASKTAKKKKEKKRKGSWHEFWNTIRCMRPKMVSVWGEAGRIAVGQWTQMQIYERPPDVFRGVIKQKIKGNRKFRRKNGNTQMRLRVSGVDIGLRGLVASHSWNLISSITP